MTFTFRHQLFVGAFVGEARFSATATARAAGYAWPSRQGPRLLQHPVVRAAIEAEFAPLRAQVARLVGRDAAGAPARAGPLAGEFLFGVCM